MTTWSAEPRAVHCREHVLHPLFAVASIHLLWRMDFRKPTQSLLGQNPYTIDLLYQLITLLVIVLLCLMEESCAHTYKDSVCQSNRSHYIRTIRF